MSQDPALPKFEVPIADKSGVTTKNWYFFFSQLLNSITGGVTKIIAGTNVTISPTSGVGDVTINATGGGGSGTVTSVATGTGLTGGPITTTGTVALANTAVTPASYTNTNLTVDAQGRITAASNGSGGSGTVTSVAFADASTTPIYSISGSPVTTSGTLTETLVTQTANTFFAGPASGAAAQPTFRALTASDLPGLGGTPSTIANLVFWFQADLLIAGSAYPILQNNAPALQGYNAQNIVSATVMTVTGTLNSKNVGTLTGAAEYVLPGLGIYPLTNTTVFVVLNPASIAANPVLFGSSVTGAYGLYINSTGNPEIVVQGVANIGASTAALSLGTWYQINATYASSTGPWAIRVARTAAGSGSLSHAVTVGGSGIFCSSNNAGAATSPFNGSVAELIVFNRVLSGTEIGNVEAYLLAKWGV